MKMRWTEKYKIYAHDTDKTGYARVASLMRYMQETAFCHMAATHPSPSELRAQGRAFILTRIGISIYAPLRHGDQIELSTWASDNSGVSYGRCFSITKDGRKVAEAASIWALYDFRAKKILRVNDVRLDYGYDDMLDLDLPRRIAFPDNVPLTLRGEYTAGYADTDENRHMNNTSYADLFCNYIPEIKNGIARASSVHICYMRELQEDSTVKIYGCSSDDIYYFRTVLSDGKTNAEAKIITETD